MKGTILFMSAAFAAIPVCSALPASGAESAASPKKLELDLPGIISEVLRRGPEAKKAYIDYSVSEADRQKFLGQYDTYAYGKGFSQYRQLSKENPAIATQGYQVGQTGVEAGIQKSFLSGTTIQAGVSSMHQKLVSPVTGVGMVTMKGYSSSVGAELTQELLKNAFGVNDRLAEKSLRTSSEMKQRAAKQAVSGAIMGAFVSYWDYVMANETYATALTAFRHTQEIRDLVGRKSRAGIAEKEELYDWEGRVLLAKNGLDAAEVGRTNSRLAVLRALDRDPGTELEIRQNLSNVEMQDTFESAYAEALRKRNDLRDMKAAVELAEMNLSIAKGNSLPSLKAGAGVGYNNYSTTGVRSSFDTINPQWGVSLTMSMPIEGTYDDACVDEAKKALAKNRILLRQLESGIRDEIRVRVDTCGAAYKIYRQTARTSEYARAYYEQVYKRFSQGRYETTQLKLAFDNYIVQKNSELKSLIDYNVALLELDIANNCVFEKYSVDIDGVIAAYTPKE